MDYNACYIQIFHDIANWIPVLKKKRIVQEIKYASFFVSWYSKLDAYWAQFGSHSGVLIPECHESLLWEIDDSAAPYAEENLEISV